MSVKEDFIQQIIDNISLFYKIVMGYQTLYRYWFPLETDNCIIVF